MSLATVGVIGLSGSAHEFQSTHKFKPVLQHTCLLFVGLLQDKMKHSCVSSSYLSCNMNFLTHDAVCRFALQSESELASPH